MFVNNGNYSTVKKQLKSGADPNIYDEEGNPLLFLPIINGDDEMLDILLSFGKQMKIFTIMLMLDLLHVKCKMRISEAQLLYKT